MFPRLVYESFRRQTRRKLLAGIAITLGVAVATAMIAVATDIGDKINRELRTYGANLVITPQEDTLDVEIGGVNLKPPSDGAFLNEADLPKIRGTFWHHNIVGFSPILPVMVKVDDIGATGSSTKSAKATDKTDDVALVGTYFNKQLTFGKEDFTTGVEITHPWWKVEGSCEDGTSRRDGAPPRLEKNVPRAESRGQNGAAAENDCAWPSDNSQNVLLGERLATKLNKHPGDAININDRPFTISGILSTGNVEDDQIVAPLAVAQQILGKPGAVRRVFVSALTKPPDALSARDPKTMTPEVYDRWYCSPYVDSIAYQLQEAIPHSHSEQIRQVAQNEGTVLNRIKGLMLLVTLAALLASALAVSAAMATAIFERRVEIGLMKALGAGNLAVSAIFFAEALLLALIGGVLGFVAGSLLAHQIGRSIFSSQISIQPVLFPIIIAIAVFVTFAGSAAAIRRAVKFDPVFSLRGQA
jgi:putative ABC transport system permease protein